MSEVDTRTAADRDFDAMVERRKELMERLREEARERAGVEPPAEPEPVDLFDLASLTQSERLYAVHILDHINPDDLFGVCDALSPEGRAAFVAGVAVLWPGLLWER